MKKILLIIVILITASSYAYAGATCTITWRQDQDCEIVDHWALFMDGIGIQSLDGSCGGPMVDSAWISGYGNHQFTLKAVTADGFESNPSNSIGATLPLVSPVTQSMECTP